jgi:hypothetical protein
VAELVDGEREEGVGEHAGLAAEKRDEAILDGGGGLEGELLAEDGSDEGVEGAVRSVEGRVAWETTAARDGSAVSRCRMAAATSPSAERGRPRTDSARRGFLDAPESDERGFFLGWKAEAAAARVVDAETTGSEEQDGAGKGIALPWRKRKRSDTGGRGS